MARLGGLALRRRRRISFAYEPGAVAGSLTMSLRTVNLNLLPILRALLREQSVSRAAETLGISQPAASAALAKLRSILNDPLLIRVGGAMQLSYRGQRMLDQVEEVSSLLENVWINRTFEPAKAERAFTIAARDYMQVVIVPRMMRWLSVQAPAISMRFLEITAEDFARKRALNIDFAFSNRAALEDVASAELVVESLYQDTIVMVISRHHRLFARQALTTADLSSDRFLIYIPGIEFLEERNRDFLTRYSPAGLTPLRSQNINSLLLIAMVTDHVALVPFRLAQPIADRLGLRIVGEAFQGEAIEVCMAWSRWHEFDPAHRWFRDLIKRAAGPPNEAMDIVAP